MTPAPRLVRKWHFTVATIGNWQVQRALINGVYTWQVERMAIAVVDL